MSPGWRTYASRALICLAVGAIAVAIPSVSVTASAVLFGALAAGCGSVVLVAGALSPSGPFRAATTIGGLGGICLGIGVSAFALALPGVTVSGLALVLAAWLILTGLLEIGGALALRAHLKGNWIPGAVGLGSLGLGVGLVAYPTEGLETLVSLLGVYALTAGALYVALAIQHRLRLASADAPPTASSLPDVMPTPPHLESGPSDRLRPASLKGDLHASAHPPSPAARLCGRSSARGTEVARFQAERLALEQWADDGGCPLVAEG